MARTLTEAAAPQNTPNADDTIRMFLEVERLKSKVDEANGKLRAQLKIMDERGINLKAVALLRRIRKLDSSEAELLFRDVSRMGRWLQVPLFQQAELFASDDAGEPSDAAKQAVSDADIEREGFEAGKDGRGANDTHYEIGSRERQSFANGWVRGQAAIASRMTDDPRQAAETRAAGGRRPGRRKARAEAAADAGSGD